MTLSNSGKPVKNGRAPETKVGKAVGHIQKPLFDSDQPELSGKNVVGNSSKKTRHGPADPKILSGKEAGSPVETPSPNAATKSRLPREPPDFDTLAEGLDEEINGFEEPCEPPSPEFIKSMYQRIEGFKQPGIYCPDWVSLITGSNKAECLVLAQIAYWFRESRRGRLKVSEFRNGRWWLYKTYRQLAKDIRVLTPGEVRWAVRNLEARGILIIDHDPAAGKPKLYRIDPVVVGRLYEQAERKLAEEMRR